MTSSIPTCPACKKPLKHIFKGGSGRLYVWTKEGYELDDSQGEGIYICVLCREVVGGEPMERSGDLRLTSGDSDEVS